MLVKIDGDQIWAVPMHGGIPFDRDDGKYTDQHRLTYGLGKFLRAELHGIMTSLGMKAGLSQIKTTYVAPHQVLNHPNIWITASPTQGEKLNQESASKLLAQLEEAVKRFFANREPRNTLHPSVDIDVDYGQGVTGVSLDKRLDVIMRW